MPLAKNLTVKQLETAYNVLRRSEELRARNRLRRLYNSEVSTLTSDEVAEIIEQQKAFETFQAQYPDEATFQQFLQQSGLQDGVSFRRPVRALGLDEEAEGPNPYPPSH